MIVELNLFLVGWLTYYRFAACRFELQCLDEWIRRKLRCYRLKQRKHGKSIAGLLWKLGVSAASASRVAKFRQRAMAHLRLPSGPQSFVAQWFHSQGLVSLVAKYDSLHH